ncbi:pyrroline-5-carboxylate reductase [Fructilactobacillus lindneri]|uniref:Pyrroline-5-carboxylate reductase n=2 Tax=Fructilactobacillus lindneri TaxID=53444 RepID=A0A0R2JNP3_9LACO|nr:pyrroline-5-carboxylate reductase [Fructilactobacillus lindneri]ANZ57775.1 pyrroline-5-carboxylate reductase [Fructilactobacillus lindneri]ANZ59044.1 pyrroline-5-carboxylate reductase [Fructilactobacillus lindneri]KRN78784.1 hypothetical protein IV52_GL001063 [Fructilactobacillus lindneri DSM 20690 = JCM 11027]POG98097.1 pyrroline-5-carboxylate reductase [Fructilactobacillus lindneri]POH01788.1 pyrroline-5-carboxylate reductase [Fructilactobacillus lindneri]
MNIGILGAGHMGSAIIRGLANKYDVNNIFVKGHHVNERLLNFQKEIGFQISKNDDLSNLDVLFITTPAAITINILDSVKLKPSTIIISAAQGVSPDSLKEVFPDNSVVAIVPNIPVAVNAGCIAMAKSDTATEKDQETADSILKSLGTLVPVAEKDLGIVGTVAGCGPAFVDVFLSALSDAAVQNGLDRETSYEVASSMVFGSAKLALDTKTNPAILKDQVTSPGGSTIKGVVALDQNGFRNAVNQAVNKANGS